MTEQTLNMDSVNTVIPEQVVSDQQAAGSEEKIRRPTLGWTLLHLRRSAHRFSRGLRKRLCVLSDEWVAAPLEEASWKLAEKVENVGQRLFQKLDSKIDQLTMKKKKTIEDEVELGRFDDEGGSMMATHIPKRKAAKAAVPNSPQTKRSPYDDAPPASAIAVHH